MVDEPETQANDDASEVDDGEDEPFRRDVNPEDRFSVSGKPLSLGELVRSTMGELASRVLELLTRPAERKRMGRQALATAREYSADAHARRLERLYEELAMNGRINS